MKGTGKCSSFGGPEDMGVSKKEGLALLEWRDLEDPRFEDLFLGTQPKGTTGLARRLNPGALYCACRWDYAQTSRELLRNSTVRVSFKGRTVDVQPADWGPHEKTGRVIDLSPGALEALGARTDDIVSFILIPPAPRKECA